MSEQPLVSIGIPTYNRAAGLRRVLGCMTTQTYQNLEIIISDNASPDLAVEEVVCEFTGRDKRIQYYKQEANKGTEFNFKFVLQKAQGNYFMWAADDDEWESNFIEVCMDAMLHHNVGSVMTGYKVNYRGQGRVESRNIPKLSDELPIKENYISYLLNISPPLFYGIHKKATLAYIMNSPPFDWSDVNFILRQILEHGFLTITDQNLFSYGVDHDVYVYKPVHPAQNRLFEYRPLVVRALRNLLVTRRVTLFVKLQLCYAFLKRMTEIFVHYEKKARPRQTQLLGSILWVIDFPQHVKRIFENLWK
jgi:glycosyltransferase involved in cell wall biosynthesis